jgi:hypothetical protein
MKIIIIIFLIILILFLFFINNKKREHLVNNKNITPLIKRCTEILNETVYSNINVMNKLSINDTEFTELVFNFAFPVGSFYVQFPVKDKNINEYSSIDEIAFPDEERPERLFGGSWQEQWPKESIFFRTRGMLSNEDRDERGFQDYATRHLYGYMSQSQTDYYNIGAGNTGVFSVKKLDEIGTDGGGNKMHGLKYFFNLQAQILPSDMENRVKNRRVKIWKRVLKNPDGKYPPLPDYGHDEKSDKNYYDGPFYKKAFANYKGLDATTFNTATKLCNEDENCKFIGKRKEAWFSGDGVEMVEGDDTTVVWEKKQGNINIIQDIPNVTFNIPDVKEEEYENDEDRPKGWYVERPEGHNNLMFGSE